MAEPIRKPAPTLYGADFAAWAEAQARVLRSRRVSALDWENLAEEIESLGGRERNEIRNRLIVLLTHLLKWQFQPEKRGHSWQSSISEQRIHIDGVIEASPSLKRFPAGILDSCYQAARRKASLETRLPLKTFPEDIPYSEEQALDDAFMPGKPWSPDDLA